jgi:tetratricopeptide (TPR) repeat protein
MGGGYALVTAADTVDLAVFKALLSRGRAARSDDDDVSAAGLLGEGLALWNGTALAGVPGPHAEVQRRLLDELRLAAIQERLACYLDLGRYAEAASELSVLVAAYPLVERFREMLMIALYGAGRQAEALAVFDATRRVLREELGVDPAPRLQEVHRRILAADPTLERPAAASAPVPPAVRVPRPAVSLVRPAQLPADVPDFVGRGDELRLLAGLVNAQGARSSPVVVIGGMAGVGKTTLAVHAAHRQAAEFPDGQLYVNLRGFGPDSASLHPAEALGSMLDAFGVPAGNLPTGLEERAALYRSLLVNRRVLVVLDNAQDAAQVRPLLPGGAGCLAIVTSRNQLPGVTATHGAHPVRLQLFGVHQAREFLRRRLGRRAATAQPAALDEIIDLCERLPLALAIVAARAAQNPAFPLAAIAEELRVAQGSLDAFVGEDEVTNARAVFSWSYEALQPQAAWLFRLLALHPGPDVAVPAAASLVALPARRTRILLAELSRAHLLTEHTSGRYGCHDLLRVYATELTGAQDSRLDREQAQHRLMDHYTHSASAASRLYSPMRQSIELPAPQPGVSIAEVTTPAQASDWFTDEYPVLLELVARSAATGGFDAHAWQLAWATSHFLDRRGLWHELATINRAAMAAAVRLGDPLAQGHIHNGLARADGHTGRLAEAQEHMYQAVELFGETSDASARADSHRQLSWVLEQQGSHDLALVHAQQALHLHRAAGDQAKQAIALNAVGWYHALLGQHRQALAHCSQALTLLEELGDRYSQADTWDSLGFARHHLGHYREAVHSYQQALRLYRELGVRYAEADTLVRLGDAHQAAGDTAATDAAWTDALAILDELEHDSAEGVRAKLHELHLRPVAPEARLVRPDQGSRAATTRPPSHHHWTAMAGGDADNDGPTGAPRPGHAAGDLRGTEKADSETSGPGETPAAAGTTRDRRASTPVTVGRSRS